MIALIPPMSASFSTPERMTASIHGVLAPMKVISKQVPTDIESIFNSINSPVSSHLVTSISARCKSSAFGPRTEVPLCSRIVESRLNY